jgi:hypothetical protein
LRAVWGLCICPDLARPQATSKIPGLFDQRLRIRTTAVSGLGSEIVLGIFHFREEVPVDQGPHCRGEEVDQLMWVCLMGLFHDERNPVQIASRLESKTQMDNLAVVFNENIIRD